MFNDLFASKILRLESACKKIMIITYISHGYVLLMSHYEKQSDKGNCLLNLNKKATFFAKVLSFLFGRLSVFVKV